MIHTLPNYNNGKLYKRWQSVSTIFGKDSILAVKTNKDGSTTQLLISDNGKKRELISKNYKIMDITDGNNTKRTYTYTNLGNGIIKGTMNTKSDGEKQLIVAAKWILNKLNLQKLYIHINTNHPDSKVFIPAKYVKHKCYDFFGLGKVIRVKEVLAKDFDNSDISSPIPKTILMVTPEKETIGITESDLTNNSINIAKQLGILSKELGNNLRTIV